MVEPSKVQRNADGVGVGGLWPVQVIPQRRERFELYSKAIKEPRQEDRMI